MIRLVTICLVSAAIRSQVTANYQAGPSGGESSPLYNLLALSLLSKYPQLNNSAGEPSTVTCTCGFCNQRGCNCNAPSQGRPSVLSGVVVFPSSELQQFLRAPAPVPLYAPSPHTTPSPQRNTPPSYIMSIPKKYSQETLSQRVFQEPYSSSQNSIYSSPQTSLTPLPIPRQYSVESPSPKVLQETFPSPQTPSQYSPSQTPASPVSPRPLYYTPNLPLIESCPATFYFPPTQPMSFNQPTVFSSVPPQQAKPSYPSFPPSPNSQPPPLPKPSLSNPPFPPVHPVTPTITKEPLVTYTLRGSPVTKDISPGTSLEAESKDCSMPTPPVLI